MLYKIINTFILRVIQILIVFNNIINKNSTNYKSINNAANIIIMRNLKYLISACHVD